MKWKLTRDACGEPFMDAWKDKEEDLRLGYSLLREMAESDDTLVEIAPGVWRRTHNNTGTWVDTGSGPGWDGCTPDAS